MELNSGASSWGSRLIIGGILGGVNGPEGLWGKAEEWELEVVDSANGSDHPIQGRLIT